jgi:phage tail-like protein
VARRHVELSTSADGVVLTAMESAGGTFVNGARLLPNQPVPLENGAVVQVGPFVLLYQAAGVPRDDAVTAAAAAAALPVAPPSASPPAAPPRPTFPAPPALGPYSRYLEFLPAIYHESDFLGRYLMINETLWEPLQQRQDHIAMFIDPRTCPEPMLGWLASWVELPLNPAWPEARRRELLGEAMDLYRWRGTRYGLQRMIEVCTGLSPEISDDPERPWVMRVRLRIPADSGVDRATVEDLIVAHKPAHVGYVLEVRP